MNKLVFVFQWSIIYGHECIIVYIWNYVKHDLGGQYYPGWPRTYNSPTSTSQVERFQSCATTACLDFTWNMYYSIILPFSFYLRRQIISWSWTIWKEVDWECPWVISLSACVHPSVRSLRKSTFAHWNHEYQLDTFDVSQLCPFSGPWSYGTIGKYRKGERGEEQRNN